MSRSLNRVQLIGNLGGDPEVRTVANGNRVANLSLATSRRWKGASGEMQEKTEWHRIVLWNNRGGGGGGGGSNLADLVERYCKKGDKIYVEGSIEYRSWQDKEGQTRYTTEVIARDVILLSGRGGADSESFTGAKAAAGAAAKPAAKDESFEDFPEALDAEDDDLPF
ncbi:MAG: single-stranded DNA-binding protein [Gemmatimonadales bacterium]